MSFVSFFFFQAEDGIRDLTVTGVQTCALPIWARISAARRTSRSAMSPSSVTAWIIGEGRGVAWTQLLWGSTASRVQVMSSASTSAAAEVLGGELLRRTRVGTLWPAVFAAPGDSESVLGNPAGLV